MLSKSQISFVNALHQKKGRKEHNLFFAEGIKSVTEFLNSDYSVETVFCTPEALSKMDKNLRKVKLVEVTDIELKKISTLTTPQGVIALIRIPENAYITPKIFEGKHTFVLDGIQDPGNLGTIIRTADWFGFTDIICSHDTVDAYNPKVVQSTMGSLSRMKIHYTDLSAFFENVTTPVFGALLDGESIYNTNFGKESFILLGNEGNGISEKVKANVDKAITIPRFGGAESLNVAITCAIFCSELKRIE